MKKDIILAGVGGQGILTIAATIGFAAMHEKLHIKQSEVHGMSQRGGEVQAHLRISSDPIYSDLIPKGKADLILSMEPLESLRYVSFLKPHGWLVTNERPFLNITNYPDFEKIRASIKEYPNHRIFDADLIARKAGSAKASNIVLLGAVMDLLDISKASVLNALEYFFSRKGQRILDTNIRALELGEEEIQKELSHA